MRYSGKAEKKPRIFWAPSEQMWAVETPYLETFLPRFKLCAGRTKRWEPQLKVWLVDDVHIADVKRIITEQWGSFDFVDKPVAPTIAVGNGAWESFVRALGYEVAHLAYKRAIAINHPDLGGDTEAASALNAAWQTIRPLLKEDQK